MTNTTEKIESKVPTIIRNEAFYAFARLCMVAALPLISFFGVRLVSAADEMRDQVAKQNIAIILLTSKVEYRFTSIEDHESRLRKLEIGSIR